MAVIMDETVWAYCLHRSSSSLLGSKSIFKRSGTTFAPSFCVLSATQLLDQTNRKKNPHIYAKNMFIQLYDT